jgi:hypothetical protein
MITYNHYRCVGASLPITSQADVVPTDIRPCSQASGRPDLEIDSSRTEAWSERRPEVAGAAGRGPSATTSIPRPGTSPLPPQGAARAGPLRPLRPRQRRHRALAVWLNEAGHRTQAGRPWSHTAVLPVLRNPVYVGKVFFGDNPHDGPHEHLVDDKLFDGVQALLSERGEDYSKRVSATSPFLLAGLVVCAPVRQALRRYLARRQPPASKPAPSPNASHRRKNAPQRSKPRSPISNGAPPTSSSTSKPTT